MWDIFEKCVTFLQERFLEELRIQRFVESFFCWFHYRQRTPDSDCSANYCAFVRNKPQPCQRFLDSAVEAMYVIFFNSNPILTIHEPSVSLDRWFCILSYYNAISPTALLMPLRIVWAEIHSTQCSLAAPFCEFSFF